MPGMSVWFAVNGAAELLKKTDPKELLGPWRKALKKAAISTEAEVKRLTPVDTGRLRASITNEMDGRAVPTWAKVYSTVKYASFVEHGSRPHYAPRGALSGWARRHGIAVGAVVGAIAKRGTRAHKMFERGWDKMRDKVRGWLDDAAREIEEGWRK